jgi:hypothetical protein
MTTAALICLASAITIATTWWRYRRDQAEREAWRQHDREMRRR